MSTTQKIAKFILPASWFDRIRDSSEKWMIQCTKCGSERSVWHAGGIRFGAASAGKRIAVRCKNCSQIVPARMYFKADASPRPDDA